MIRLHSIIQKTAFRAVFVFICLLLPLMLPAQTTKVKNMKTTFLKPDFAFPETVSLDARKALEKARINGDELIQLRALLQILVADNIISPDSVMKNVALIEDCGQNAKDPFKGLFQLLTANVYRGVYNENRFVFNRRKLEPGNNSTNPAEWSASRFASEINRLVSESLVSLPELCKIDASRLSEIFTDVNSASRLGLSAGDIMVANAIDVLQSFDSDGQDNIIPFYPVSEESMSPSSHSRQLAVELAQTRVDYYESHHSDLPLVWAISQRSNQMNNDGRREYLKEWILKFNGKEGEGYLLHLYFQTYLNGTDDEKERKEIYEEMQKWLTTHPSGWGVSDVRNDIDLISKRSGRCEYPRLVVPGDSVKVKVNLTNINEGWLKIYRLKQETEETSLRKKELLQRSAEYARVKVMADGIIPFSKETEVSLPPLPVGQYVIIVSATPKSSALWGDEILYAPQIMCVSDINVMTASMLTGNVNGVAYVVSSHNQRPIEGARVECWSLERTPRKLSSGVTSSDGSYVLPDSQCRVKALHNGSIASTNYYYSRETPDTTVWAAATLLTDLGIYHPGDTVHFVAIGWTTIEGSRMIMKNGRIELNLIDSKGQTVETKNLTTDENGRVVSEMRLPVDGSLGYYRIEAGFPDYKNIVGGTVNFQVAEYKAPEFFVALEKQPSEEYMAVLSGVATTYSGLPIVGGKVDINIEWLPAWRWGGSSANWSTQTSTDEKGNFSLKLPMDNLIDQKWERGFFTVTADVTSISGETQKSEPLRFTIGKKMVIEMEVPNQMKVTSDSVVFKLMVRDLMGLPVKYAINYQITTEDTGKIVVSGRTLPPFVLVPASELTSGKYMIEAWLEGSEEKYDTVSSSVVIWRSDDTRPPIETPLWVPERNMQFSSDAKEVKVTVGSSWQDSWLLCLIDNGNGKADRRWIKCNGENIILPVAVLNKKSYTTVILSGMHDFQQKIENITLIRTREELRINASSFRDRTIPGMQETWRFSVTNGTDAVGALPVMAVMTNKALESLAPFNWRLPQGSDHRQSFVSLSRLWNGKLSSESEFDRYRWKRGVSLPSCEWQTYGYSLAGGRGRFFYQTEMQSDGMTNVVTNSFAMKRSASVMLAEGSTGIVESVAVVDESADAEEEVPTGSPSVEYQSENWRGAEMPVAFFNPMMLSDKDGNVEIEFQMPNFNTTWHFQLAAYTPEMDGVVFSHDVIASKRVIINTNYPRFLRTGDKATLLAAFFNNSTDTLNQEASLRVIDETSGKILCENVVQEEMHPAQNRTISVEFSVPFESESLIVEARTWAGKNSDAERIRIKVLPNTNPVEESSVFYLKPDATEVSVRIPKIPSDAKVELRYNLNPIWNCLRAMSTIRDPQSKDALSMADALYANLTSARLLAGYKEIALNQDSVNRVSERLLSTLKELQTDEGGWTWCKGMESSLFITQRVLGVFSALNREGLLDETGREMARDALRWGEKKLLDEAKVNNGKFSVYTMLAWLSETQNLNLGKPVEEYRKLRNRALEEIASEWRKFSLVQKANAVIVLKKYGKDSQVPLILESLKQMATKSPTRGWWFDNHRDTYSGFGAEMLTSKVLKAFSVAAPQSDAVDGLRQWILLQSETIDFSSSSSAVAIVESLLSCGTNWIGATSVPTVRIGKRMLHIPGNIQSMGTAVIALSASEVSGKTMTITKISDSPGWGGVLASWVAPIQQIKSAPGLNLQVSKKIYKVIDGKLEECPLSIGDQVKVIIDVKCEKSMDYVTVTDNRSAALEPVRQISGMTMADAIPVYESVGQTSTTFFVQRLPKGITRFVYDAYVDRVGDYASGIVQVRSEFSPIEVAHSAGSYLPVNN